MKVKDIILTVAIVLLVGGLTGCIIALARPPKKDALPDTGCTLHIFEDGICTECGIKEADARYTMDVVTNDCSIKIYADDTFRVESFGAGVNGYTVANLYDNTSVRVTSNFSATTKVNVFRCTYNKYGEYIGYPKDDTTTLLEGRAYNKELVYTLSVLAPIYEIREKSNCLYIFEIVKEEQIPETEKQVLLSSKMIEPEAYAQNDIDGKAVTVYTITATIQPEHADNKAVSWSIAWQDPNSDWASGKNISDYITLSSNTANPVTVTCKQAFGEQAIVTCTSQDNSELNASCTVDYKQKLSSIASTVQINGTSYSLNQSVTTLPIASNAMLDIAFNKTVGSISDEFTVTTTVRFSDECIAWLESNYDNWGTGYNKQMTISSDGTFSIDYLLSESNPDCLFVPEISGGIYGSSASGMFFYQYLLPDFNAQTFPKLLFTVTVTDSSGNESRYEYKACLERLTVAAVSLSLNNTGIIF